MRTVAEVRAIRAARSMVSLMARLTTIAGTPRKTSVWTLMPSYHISAVSAPAARPQSSAGVGSPPEGVERLLLARFTAALTSLASGPALSFERERTEFIRRIYLQEDDAAGRYVNM